MSTLHRRTVRWVAFDDDNIPTDWHYQETVWSDGFRDLEYWDDFDDWMFLPRWYRMSLPSVSFDNWSEEGGVRVAVRPQDSEIIEAEVVESDRRPEWVQQARDRWGDLRRGLAQMGDRFKSGLNQVRRWIARKLSD